MQSPFRCVDEINQGMDERNERLIMSRIVANTAGKDEPQYFLITPKLLPALTSMEQDHVAIHFVFNGPGVLKQTAWKIHTFVGRDEFEEMEEEEAPAASSSSSSNKRRVVAVADDEEEEEADLGGEDEQEDENDDDDDDDDFELSGARPSRKQSKRQRKSR